MRRTNRGMSAKQVANMIIEYAAEIWQDLYDSGDRLNRWTDLSLNIPIHRLRRGAAEKAAIIVSQAIGLPCQYCGVSENAPMFRVFYSSAP